MSHLPPPTTLPPGSIVDAYVRDSGGPRQDASTDQQLAEIQTYCQQHGLTLRHKFVDVAKSGGSTVTRDEFNKLIDSTRRLEDRPQGVLLWNYARFARDLDDAIYYKALLRNRNIIVHSLTDPIPEGQYGRIIEFFIDISNEEKRRQTSEDAKRGLRDLVLKHRCVPGTPPVGFKREPVTIGTRRDGTPHVANRWVPDPNIIPRIKRAFDMRAAGRSLSDIHTETRIFNSLNSYKTFFANKIFIGILEFGDLIIENYCDPVIDMQTWNKVQEIIQDYARARTKERHPKRIASPYLLSGLVYCGFCDAPMSGSTTTRDHITGRDEAYRCSRAKRKAGCSAPRVPRRVLEDAVLGTLREQILLPDSLAAMIEVERHSTDHRETRRKDRLTALESDKKRLSTQIANTATAVANRGGSQTLLDKLSQLESERAVVVKEITELNSTHFEVTPQMTQDELFEASRILAEDLLSGDLPVETMRPVLQSFIHKVTVKKEEKQFIGTLSYYIPPLADLLRPPDDPPPFDFAPTDGIMLPVRSPSVGAQAKSKKRPPKGGLFLLMILFSNDRVTAE
jgi:DNA invertase Pin-like site-specific DNA recombinase